MNFFDITIITSYILLTLVIGIWFSKRASKGLKSYFLGGNSIKWYYLGLSNSSGMFDVSGTAWMVGILFLYGVKSFMFMWLWPIWNQVFVMMFLAIWIRRSHIMTGSEWILTRFGDDRSGRASHIIVVIFAVMATVGFIAYFFEGVGKFAAIILPWNLTAYFFGEILLTSSQSYALIIILLTTLYTIKGGMFSVVTTEVLQYIVMVLAGLLLSVYVFIEIDTDNINAIVSKEWKSILFGWQLPTHWSETYQTFDNLIDKQGYKMFGAFVGMTLFKGFFASIAGPTPSYDMQRILSTKNVKEAAYMSGFTNLVLFIPRYLLIASIVVLALVHLAPSMIGNLELSSQSLEILLPQVINSYVPTGIKGLLLAGLLAAFMSTFSAFVNAGPAYIVNDIYKKYMKPKAPSKHYIKASYIASFLVVFLGVFMGFFAESINTLTLWITSALFGGYVAANFLKWVWWRFNGWGYFWGMLAGLLVASLQFALGQYKGHFMEGSILHFLSEVNTAYLFPIIFVFSLSGAILGTLLTKPTNLKTLMSFYESVRPWGWWTPVYKKIKAKDKSISRNTCFWTDMLNCFIGIIWQSSMIILPIYFVIRDYHMTIISVFIFLLTSLVLKYSWLKKVKTL